MNPRAIGIDILIDQAQPEDPELIAAMRAMRTPTFLAFASAERNPDQILPWQEEFLTGFLRQVSSGPVRPASIRLRPDLADGVIRRWPDQPTDLPPLLANAMTPVHPEFRSYRRSIDFRVPASGRSDEVTVFTNLPIQFVAEFPEGVRAMIEGRYVLIGGDIQDLDDYETPMSRAHRPLDEGPRGPCPYARPAARRADAGGDPGLGAVDRRPRRRRRRGADQPARAGAAGSSPCCSLVQIAVIGYLPFLLQQMRVDTLDLPAFGWGVGWLLAFVGVGTAARAVGSEQTPLRPVGARQISAAPTSPTRSCAIPTSSRCTARRSRSTPCSPISRASPS